MKSCKSCGQIVSEKITTCPACGSQLVDRIKFIDYYHIQKIIHEGRSSLLFKATRRRNEKPVSIRLFTKESGVNENVAQRLKQELDELQKLPPDHFVQHYAIKKSAEGHWYRVSEWVEADSWGNIFLSDTLNDQRRLVTLFLNIASCLDILHKSNHFMPYLLINDILTTKGKHNELKVKINYKLSRFLDPQSSHHSPMLQKLLDCHPDIINNRALDFKSAIWSLGKIFAEILAADHNLTDFSSKIDTLDHVDPDLAVLVKIMLSDDPDLRPQSMAKVVSSLSRILNRLPYSKNESIKQKKPRLINEINWMKRVIVFLIFVVIGFSTFSTLFWLFPQTGQVKKEAEFATLVESYADSIAFVMVEYWLKENETVLYKKKVEGTAFLVDQNGYLLTNRHVACPWLDDVALFQLFSQYSIMKKSVEFDFRMFLWFEGEKAFNRLPELSDSVDPSDVYYLTSAHRTDKKGNLRIVGVPRSITKTGELIRSPFKNDFAVLKIDDIPENLKPLPLAGKIDPQDIQRLSPVLILGFPLGHKTQDDHINASVTRGHVRRTSKEMIQVDSSIYKGNSGGPAINSNGQVIGIATGVVTDQTPGYFKVLTPLSDFGLILPISRPASFIENLKIGQLKWNGIIDFSVENKLEQIKALAFENKFNEAAFLATEFTDSGNEPLLFFAAGMLNFCSNNFEKSKGFFYKVTSIEAENTSSKLMIFVMDWLDGTTSDKEFTKELLNMDWRHPDEFLGYLVQVIKNSSRMDLDYLEWENMAEMGWRYFIEGLMLEKEKNFSDAANMFKQAILNSGVDEWVYFLSFSRLQLIQNQHIKFVADKEKYRQETEAFKKTAIQKREESSEKGKIIASLIQRSEAGNTTYEEKLQIYEALLAIAPDNRAVLAKMAFFYATNSVWEKALEYIHAYMEVPGRETALSLSLGLLKGQIFNITDQKDKAKKHLEKFRKETKDSWYSIIGKNLLSGPNETALIKIAGKNPEKLITMHTALGLWAEGAQDKERAAHHYREALGSYLDNRMEYYLALGRIVRFRQNLD